jgi:protein SCO1/2
LPKVTCPERGIAGTVTGVTKWLPLAIASVLVVGACGGNGGSKEFIGFQRPDPLVVSEVSLPDVTDGAPQGARFNFIAEPDHLLMVYFGFTNCPDLCPTTLAEVRAAKKRLGDDGNRIDLAVVTVDPERDTPQVLNEYVSSFSDDYRVLRTDDDNELRTVEEAFLASSTVSKAADGTVEVSHTANLYAVDDAGRVVLEMPFGIGTDGVTNDLELLLDGMSS